jgi:hypothetical protein
MQVLSARCAGLDVHQQPVVATIMLTAPTGQRRKLTRALSTMTADLLALDHGLEEQQGTPIAMESPGVYWYPVYNLLEAGRSVILVHPQPMRICVRSLDARSLSKTANGAPTSSGTACSTPALCRPTPFATCAH